MTEMTVALDVLNSNLLSVQSGVGVKNYPLCYFLFRFFVPGVLLFSIQNCLMMQSLSGETKGA